MLIQKNGVFDDANNATVIKSMVITSDLPIKKQYIILIERTDTTAFNKNYILVRLARSFSIESHHGYCIFTKYPLAAITLSNNYYFIVTLQMDI